MSYMTRVKHIWAAVYDSEKEVRAVIEEFFHPDYEQCINGVIMHRTEYIDHVMAQKKNMFVERFEYRQHLETGEDLFAIYYPKGKNAEGFEIEAEVISYFRFKDNKILRIHGQVRLIKGEFSDVDMHN